jgi:hypothetical protein
MNRARKNLIDRLETSGQEFAAYLATFSEDEIRTAPAPNEWNIHQIVAHLRDVEQQVFLVRVQRLVKETHPAVVPFDQDAWQREHYTADEPFKKILREFRVAHRKWVAVLRKTGEKDWANWATHPEFGKISLEWIALHSYQHTLDHHAQIVGMREKRVLAQLREAK